MATSFNFVGKTILVTGAGRGIGRELAKAIGNAGGKVYALGRTKEHIDSLANTSDNIHPIVLNLRDWNATKDALEGLEALDGVVNNAAKVTTTTNAIAADILTLEKMLRVNVIAPFNVIQITAKKMMEAGKHGSIVNVSSVCGASAVKIKTEYGVSKAALDQITKQFAQELGPHNIRVNSVSPTWVYTEGVKELFRKYPEIETSTKLVTPLGRFCELHEAVEPILYLLSDQSSMVTGTVHFVDGGMLCNIPLVKVNEPVHEKNNNLGSH